MSIGFLCDQRILALMADGEELDCNVVNSVVLPVYKWDGARSVTTIKNLNFDAESFFVVGSYDVMNERSFIYAMCRILYRPMFFTSTIILLLHSLKRKLFIFAARSGYSRRWRVESSLARACADFVEKCSSFELIVWKNKSWSIKIRWSPHWSSSRIVRVLRAAKLQVEAIVGCSCITAQHFYKKDGFKLTSVGRRTHGRMLSYRRSWMNMLMNKHVFSWSYDDCCSEYVCVIACVCVCVCRYLFVLYIVI